ncbi:MAG: 2,3-diphosphoglycerate-dependent phosphoglycerate mutase [Bdellovibrionota bacterium]
MYQLVIVRHGESLWNQQNRFTGWQDVDLAEKGKLEAKCAGDALKSRNFEFDQVYTSVLKRAIKTLDIILEGIDQQWLQVHKDWRLNERHYGGLQGLDKAETAAKHGEAQVKIWRRSYDTPPPRMEPSDPRHPSHDRRYKNIPMKDIPNGESLKDTAERFMPLWIERIQPDFKLGKKILIVAHGNSLRALIQYLEKMSADDIMQVNVPTGVPIFYELDLSFQVLKKEFLGDPEEIRRAMESVANQGKAKSP